MNVNNDTKRKNKKKMRKKYKFSIYVRSFDRCLFPRRFMHLVCVVFVQVFYQFFLIHLYSFQVIYFLNARLNSVIDTEHIETNTETAAKMLRALAVRARNGIESTQKKPATFTTCKRDREMMCLCVYVCVQSKMESGWKRKLSQNVIRVHRWLVELGQTNRLRVSGISNVVIRAHKSDLFKSIEHDLLLFTFHLTAIEQ